VRERAHVCERGKENDKRDMKKTSGKSRREARVLRAVRGLNARERERAQERERESVCKCAREKETDQLDLKNQGEGGKRP